MPFIGRDGRTAFLPTSVNTSSSLKISNEGDLIVDTDTLFVDSSAGKVGIGTQTPTLRAHIYSTENADAALIESTQNFATLRFKSATNTSGPTIGIDGAGGFQLDQKDTSKYIAFAIGTEKLRIASSGQIGIGGANYGTAGQVLTSGGASGAVSWTTVSVSGLLSSIVEDTTPQLGGDLESNGNDIDFADGDKAIFGAGSDLQIYHDGSTSYINNGDSGGALVINNDGTHLYLRADNNIYIQTHGAENSIVCHQDGAVELYYDTGKKFTTTNTGVTVTGALEVSAATNITVGGTALPSLTNLLGGSLNGTLGAVTMAYLAAAPSSPIQGQFYFNSLSSKAQIYTGSAFVDLVPSGGGGGGGGGSSSDANATFRKYTYAVSSTTSSISGSSQGETSAGSFVIGLKYTIKTPGNTDFTAIGAGNNTAGTAFVATGAGSGTGDAYNTLIYSTGGDQNVEVYVNGVKAVEGATNDYVATSGTSVNFVANLASGDVVDVQVYELLTNDAFVLASGGTFTGNVGINTTSINNRLHIHSNANEQGILLTQAGNNYNVIYSDSNRTGANDHLLAIEGHWNGTPVAEIALSTGSDTTNKDDGVILFRTSSANNLSTSERMRITSDGKIGIGGLTNPGALLSIPAGESNTPRLAIESAVDDNDFTITQYEDSNGTYTMLGQNVKLNSGGNNTILDSGHKTAGILLDARNHGAITFLTGDTNAVGEPVKITAAGYMGIGTNGPGAPLHILSSAYPTALIQRDHGTNYPRLRLTNTSNNGADIDGIGDGSPAGGFRISTVNAATSTERFRIYSEGAIRIRGINRNSTFSVGNVPGTMFVLDDTEPSAIGTGGRIVFGSKYYTGSNTMGTAFIGSYKENAPNNGVGEYHHSLILGTRSSSDGLFERLRIDSAGRMGLGANNPGDYDGEANDFVVRSANHTGITIASSGTNQRCNLYFSDGTSGSEKYRGAFTYDHNNDSMMMRTAGGERFHVTSEGQIHLGNSGFGTTKVGGQSITGQDTSATLKLYDTRADMWGMQLRRDTNTNPNGIFVRAGNTSSNYSLYVCGTNESVTHLACRGDGNVGIGTNSPTVSHGIGLNIAGVNAGLRIQNTADTGWAYMEYADESNTVKYIHGYRDVSGLYSIRPGNSIAGTAGITMQSNGNISIGTDAPPSSAEFTVRGANPELSLYATANYSSYLMMGDTNDYDNGYIEYDNYANSRGFKFVVNSLPIMRLRAWHGSGNAYSPIIEAADGVGMYINGSTGNMSQDNTVTITKTNNNDWALSVRCFEGTSTDYGMYSRVKNGTSYALAVYDHDNSAWRFRVNGGGTIYAVNTTVQSISDVRLKENIVDANSQWDDIKALRFRNYKWKEESGYADGKTYLGLIAQEVETISPGLVEINAQTKEDIENEVPDPEHKNVKYSIVWMKAMKALQEAMERIETLEQRLADAGID